jgi:hypothetical protein
VARPSKLTDEAVSTFMSAIAAGNGPEVAARFAGFSESTAGSLGKNEHSCRARNGDMNVKMEQTYRAPATRSPRSTSAPREREGS